MFVRVSTLGNCRAVLFSKTSASCCLVSRAMQSSVEQTSTVVDAHASTSPQILNPPAAGRPSRYLESELESVSTSSESTSTSESDPGKVISDFDAAVTTSMDYGWGNTPRGHGRGGRSIKSFQPSYVPSPLNRAHNGAVSPQPAGQHTTPLKIRSVLHLTSPSTWRTQSSR